MQVEGPNSFRICVVEDVDIVVGVSVSVCVRRDECNNIYQGLEASSALTTVTHGRIYAMLMPSQT